MRKLKILYRDHTMLALQLSIMLAALFTLYRSVTTFSYIWDDNTIRQMFPYLTAEPSIALAFSNWFLTPEYYRPLAVYTMMIEYHLGTPALAPYYAHSINLGLFASCASLIFLIAVKLCRAQHANIYIWPLVVSMLFVCHPALLAGPAWAAVRFDLLMTTFALLVLASDLVLPSNRLSLLVTGCMFLCAALSKESAISLALLLPFWHLFIANKHWQGWHNYISWIKTTRHLYTYIAIACAGILYLLIRFSHTDLTVLLDSGARDVGSPMAHALYVGKTFIMYLHLIVWPFDMISPAYTQIVPIQASDQQAVIGLTLLGLATLMCLFSTTPRIKWSLLILLITLFPVLNLKVLNIFDNIIDIRYTYLPITLLCLSLVMLLPDVIHKLPSSLRIASASTYTLWILAGFMCIKATLPYWKDELIFWRWYVAKAPTSHNAHLNLGSAYLERGLYPDAITQTLLALQDSRDALPTGILMNLGIAYVRNGDFISGFETLGKIKDVELAPQYSSVILSYYAEACLRSRKDNVSTENNLLQALQLNPDNLHGQIMLAYYYHVAGQANKKAAALAEAHRLTGGNNNVLVNTLQNMNLPAELLSQ